MKRKTDEQRAIDFAVIADKGKYSYRYSFIAAIRSERRAMRKEIGELLNGLLAAERKSLSSAGCTGILLAMHALKVKEQK